MSDEKPSWAPPGDVPNHHERLATRLRALAADATTGALKSRLLEEAQREERLAKLA
jgi:hypothetical protein